MAPQAMLLLKTRSMTAPYSVLGQAGVEFSNFRVRGINMTTLRQFEKFIGTVAIAGIVLAAAPASAATQAEIAMYKGSDRQAMLEKGAKKEGKVVLYSSMIVHQAIVPILNGFKKKYPYINTGHYRSSSRKILVKIGAERRANALAADVLELGGGGDAPQKMGAVEPFTSPVQKEYPAAFVSKSWNAIRMTTYGMVYNTKKLKEAEVPHSYADLLDPKWKGRIAWRASSETGDALVMAQILKVMGVKKGTAYIKKFAKQKIVNLKISARTIVDRVGQGEYDMCFGCSAHHPLISKLKGAPTDVVMFNPTPVNVATVYLLKGANNPYAAMLLIDFMLAKDGGQKILKGANYLPAHPEVPPADHMKRIVPSLSGLKSIVYNPDNQNWMRDDRIKLLKLFK